MRDVVYIDFTDEFVDFHKENCILIPKFVGDREDRSLMDLLPFLERKSEIYLFLFS